MADEASGRWWLDRAFVYLGRMDPSKGVAVMVRAYASLASEIESLPMLWIVGGVPEEIERVRASIRDVVEPLEARKLISWWGFQRPAAISGLLSKSLALLMHSQYEPGGRVVLEALAAGLPVIATPNGFAIELVYDWISGFVVPYGDIDLLRARMAHFVRQPLLRNAMGARGRALALEALNAWRFVDAHCEVYDEAVRHGPGERFDLDRAFVPPQADVLRTRTFPPTYPWTRAPADDGMVESFIQRYRHTLRLLPRRNSALPLWRAADSEGEFVVKQVEARFDVRVLWDPHAGPDLLRAAEARLAMEIASQSFPPFAPLSAHSEEHGIIMRPVGEIVPLTTASIASFARALKALGRYELPDVSAHVARAPSCATRDELAFTLANLRQMTRKAYPHWRCTTPSLDLGWRLRLADVTSGLLCPGEQWTSRDTAAAECLTERAARWPARVVVTHGNPDPAHFLLYGDTLHLIAGGDLECAAAGKDLGSLLLHALIPSDFTAALALLETCEPSEDDAVLAWAGLLAIEGLCRNTVLRRATRVRYYRRLWSALRDLLAISR